MGNGECFVCGEVKKMAEGSVVGSGGECGRRERVGFLDF